MKFWILLLFMGMSFFVNAQEIEHEGVKYEIKGKSIFQDGKDVTATLSVERKEQLMAIHEKSKAALKEAEVAKKLAADKQKEVEKAASKLEKEQKQADKALKDAQKAQKSAEKAQKKAVKELKLKQKAQDNFEKASKKLEQNQDKYDKLKSKGKLSPIDEAKWLKKLRNYRKDVDKTQIKLSKS